MKQNLTPEQIAMRKLFLPRHAPVSEQCVSCPFREGNDTEWRELLQKLRTALNIKGKVTKAQALAARVDVFHKCQNSGEFSCHHSVYNADATMKPTTEHRQCLGALKFFQGEEV